MGRHGRVREVAEQVGHEWGPKDRAQREENGDRALQLALGVRGDAVRHQRVGHRHHHRRAPPGDEPGEHHPPVCGGREAEVTDRAEGDPQESRAALPDPRHQQAHHPHLGRDHHQADGGQRRADHRGRPAEAVLRVERPRRRHHLVGQAPQKQGDEQPEDEPVPAHLGERA